MFVWPHPPNWSNGFDATIRYLTEVLRSYNGKEQRIAKRFHPRLSFEFEVMPRRDAFHLVQRDLYRHGRDEMLVPFWPSRQRLATAPTGATVEVDEVRDWMVPGKRACIVQNGAGEDITISGVSGTTLTLQASVAGAWTAGADIMEAFPARLDDRVRQRAFTDTVTRVDLQFDVVPGQEGDYTPGPAGTTFDGLEVFEFPINWQTAPRLDMEHEREIVDFDYGVNRVFQPIAFPTLIKRGSLLRNGFAAVREVEDFFRRHRGRQREFYFPNPVRDMRAAVGLTTGSNVLLVDDPLLADMLAGDTVHRAIAVKTTVGTFYRQIMSAVQSGPHTQLQLRTNWPVSIPLENIGRIAFLNVANFASDAFSFEWRSYNVATTSVTISTLEDFWSA